MLIHVNVGTYLDARSEMNIHFTGVNEGCEAYFRGLWGIEIRAQILNRPNHHSII